MESCPAGGKSAIPELGAAAGGPLPRARLGEPGGAETGAPERAGSRPPGGGASQGAEGRRR
eukprot:8956912-Pyramimonas_sp.AAC.1